MRTTAIQAQEMAPWWLWWAGLCLATLVAHPLALGFYFRSRARTVPHVLVWITSGLHLATGAMTFLLMFAVSIAYSSTSPLGFIAAWGAASIIITVAACVAHSRWSRRA